MEVERTLRARRRIVSDEVHNQGVHDEVVLNYLRNFHRLYETVEQTISQLMTEENAMQEAAWQATRKEKARQVKADRQDALKERKGKEEIGKVVSTILYSLV